MKGKNPKKTLRLTQRYAQPAPPLRLTPYAWAKLLFLRDAGPTEIGAFGISAASSLLLIEDFRLVKQTCSVATVRFDDESVADFFDEQVDQGLTPERFGRIWVHTHPGSSPVPSVTDEETFARCFGGTDWSLMLILACGGRTYARLRFGVGPRASLMLPIEIDFGAGGPAMDLAAWDQEYQDNVSPDTILAPAIPASSPIERGTPALAEDLPMASNDPFFDPARFDPWECLYERYF
jgi:proteasome lid subunit RPN8/RPN11